MAAEKNPVVALVSAAFGIAAMVYAFQAFSSIASIDTTVPSAAPSEAVYYDAGTPVSDGQFTFTANTPKCGVKRVGDEKATGLFCILLVTIENTGAEQQMIDESEQFLIDVDGRKYGISSSATYTANGGFGVDELNPGLSASVKLVFDLPIGLQIVGAEFHDSFMSAGTHVYLS